MDGNEYDTSKLRRWLDIYMEACDAWLDLSFNNQQPSRHGIKRTSELVYLRSCTSLEMALQQKRSDFSALPYHIICKSESSTFRASLQNIIAARIMRSSEYGFDHLTARLNSVLRTHSIMELGRIQHLNNNEEVRIRWWNVLQRHSLDCKGTSVYYLVLPLTPYGKNFTYLSIYRVRKKYKLLSTEWTDK